MSKDTSVKLHNSLPGTPNFFRQLAPRPAIQAGKTGWLFQLWAPEADQVSVAGDFNRWDPAAAPMTQDGTGLWKAFLPQPEEGQLYKYVFHHADGTLQYYSDPWAVSTEPPPGTAARLFDLDRYAWQDENWLRFRRQAEAARRPQTLYHIQLSAWRRTGAGEALSCRELTAYLVPYLKKMGYTGAVIRSDNALFFAPPAALDSPDGWMYLIDQLHQAGLSAFLDWHPDRCPAAYNALLALNLPSDGDSPSDSLSLDWTDPEVRSLLIASATFWLDRYHLDGLRIDAADPVRYLRGSGARNFLGALQREITRLCPDATLILNSPFPLPDFAGWQERSGLPLLDLFQGAGTAPCAELLSDGLLALSASQFQAPAPSFLDCFSGNDAARRAAARACYLAFLALPGRKLVSMGTELGQHIGWRSNVSLDWHLLERTAYQTHHAFFQAANALYLTESVLWSQAFQWYPVFCGQQNLLSFLRQATSGSAILCLCNPTATPFSCGTLSLPGIGTCQILLSSDEKRFGGANTCSILPCPVAPEQPGSHLQVYLPPRTCVLIRYIPARRPDPLGSPPPDSLRSR